jgi:squalene-associated FAD-dependent desaturase
VTGDRVVVIGGGLAGISAAIEVAERGLPVTLLESRPWLGGATWSFGRRGLTIDNGQHAFLRCFTAYQDLLTRLGVSHLADLQDRLDLTVLAAEGSQRIRRNSWPAPLHLARMLAGYGLLSRGERLGVVPAVLAMWLNDLSRQRHASVAEWLGRHGQGERARRQLWEVFLVPVLNAVSEQADLGTAAGVINAALLTSRDRADIGVPWVPLRDLHGRPAASLLARLGAEVRVSTRVAAVTSRRGGGFSVRVDSLTDESQPVRGSSGEPDADEIHAAGVVLAVPAWSAADLVPPELSLDVSAWRKLTPSPLISIHVMYDTRVTRLPFAVSGESALRWIADKTRSAGLHTGQYLAASIPAADKLVDAPSAAIREEFLPVLERLFPGAASARVEDFFVTRERSATFRPVPGSAAFRPDQMTKLPGFALAGAWTRTGWPDTVEGAVRSGRRAAECVLRALLPAEALAPVPGPATVTAGEDPEPAKAEKSGAVVPVGGSETANGTAETAAPSAEPAAGDEPTEVTKAADGPKAAEVARASDEAKSPEEPGSAEIAGPAADAQSAHASNPSAGDVVAVNGDGAVKGAADGQAVDGATGAADGQAADKVKDAAAANGTSAGKSAPTRKSAPAANAKRGARARGGIEKPVPLTAPDAVPERAKAAGQ